MKNQLKQVFHSPRFVIGFVIFVFMLGMAVLYPLLVPGDPLEMVASSSYPPGTYISLADTLESKQYGLDLDITATRLNKLISQEDKDAMVLWLTKYRGIAEEDIPVEDSVEMVHFWNEHYDPEVEQKGLTNAKRQYYRRLASRMATILETKDIIIATKNPETGALEESNTISFNTYTNVKDIASRRNFVLGTDNFGRDVLKELTHAVGTSLKMGLLAGVIATLIGLTLGLLSGYLGGLVDDIIMFVTNLFTVIPSFVLIILISFSVSQSARGVMLVGVIIGLTSWTWTTRSVRSQVISLRNRDHVNLSKLSGHSLPRIIVQDILPYIASYVVMALILQISSAILAEAQLSMLGLGPSTTKVATLGLMMNWAMTAQAPLAGRWWAFLPIILSIALITFSLNLMNTGLDQVFNPQLRD